MSAQGPALRLMVEYTLTGMDADRVNTRRTYSAGHPGEVRGNQATAGQVYPMLITRVWGTDPTSAVNGQVFLDGNDSLWVTSATAGDGEGKFRI